ncbi:uncharacterized protein LOC125215492 isoform X2 [Salvia hispanica]|uniref:uncharacterized protein LOC125215492 isoform X2 n=1 Tax=Salvia hispanica TaxID=49212 RepID=UPI0020091049|nr:uncharacterized protein LOC125215492 isoform X2 [Salvia hispanica]
MKSGLDSSTLRRRACAGPMLTRCPAATRSAGARTPPATSSANASAIAKAASALNTTTSSPFPKFCAGGESVAANCQILQTRVNRFKSDKEGIDDSILKGYSCDIKFTDKELDIVEMAVYGDVIRPGNQCRCRTVAEMLGQHISKDKKAPCKLPYDDTPS